MKIFCVNLERAVERKDSITRDWIEQLGLDISFWKAYDRRLIQEGNHFFSYNDRRARRNLGRSLSYGEIACATSFFQLFHYIVDSEIEECIIMEDDITPYFNNIETLFETISRAKEEFPDAGMLLMHNPHPRQLQFYSSKRYDKTVRFNDIFFLRREVSSMCRKAPWGNQFFYINRKCIRIVLDYVRGNHGKSVIWFPADHFQKLCLSPLGLVSILNKPLCYHDWSGSTYIGNDLRNSSRTFVE